MPCSGALVGVKTQRGLLRGLINFRTSRNNQRLRHDDDADQVSAAIKVLQLVETNLEEVRLAMFGRHLSGKLTRPLEKAVIGSRPTVVGSATSIN
jgi:hypothetical protein